ncbi:MAG: rhomboid family intramembrane serine protease [Nitrososphaerales archaeon]
MFVHANIVHIAFNLVALAYLGVPCRKGDWSSTYWYILDQEKLAPCHRRQCLRVGIRFRV